MIQEAIIKISTRKMSINFLENTFIYFKVWKKNPQIMGAVYMNLWVDTKA